MPSPPEARNYAHFAAATGRHSQSLAPKRYALMLSPLPIASAAIRTRSLGPPPWVRVRVAFPATEPGHQGARAFMTNDRAVPDGSAAALLLPPLCVQLRCFGPPA